MDSVTTDVFEWASTAQIYPGETAFGDGWCALPQSRGLRVAVVDGLGHGALAGNAARRAVGIVAGSPGMEPDDLLRLCDDGLRKTRGVALSLVDLDAVDGTLTWIGVGNVAALLARREGGRLRCKDMLVSSAGILGRRAPILPARTVSLLANDILLLTTDGLRADFQAAIPNLESLQGLTDRLVQEFKEPSDDALAVAVRFRGAHS